MARKATVKEQVVTTFDQLPEVDEVRLIAHERATGYKAIVDKTNMNTICVVKDDNRIIQHRHVLQEVQNLKDYTVKSASLMRNGVILSVDVAERIPKKVEYLPNDFLECGAQITNAYDRHRGLSVAGSGIRLVCSNGLTAPHVGERMQVEAYGTAEFSGELEEKIEKCLNIWTDVTELMTESTKKVVSVKNVVAKHAFLPKKYMNIITNNLKDRASLYDIWNEYSRTITHDIIPYVTNHEPVVYMKKRANKILLYEE